jgi:MFS family permease
MHVLKNRNFAILYSGQLLSSLGNSLYGIALPWYVYALTRSKLDMSISGMAEYVPGIAGMFAGVYVDRWLKRDTMLYADALRTLVLLAMFMMARMAPSFLGLFALVVLLEVVGSFFGPAASALTPLVVSESELAGAMGLQQSSSGVASLVGLSLGGALITWIGAPFLFLSNAVSFVLSVISLRLIRVPETPRPKHTRDPFLQEWWQGIRLIVQSQVILRLIAASLISNVGMGALMFVIIAWVKGPLHETAVLVGILQMFLVGGAITGGILLGRIAGRVQSSERIVQGSFLVMGAALVGLGVLGHWYVAVGVMALIGAMLSFGNGTVNAIMAKSVPETIRGRFFGGYAALCLAVGPLSLLMFGLGMQHQLVPLRVFFVIIGALNLASGFLFFLPVRDDLDRLSHWAASPV